MRSSRLVSIALLALVVLPAWAADAQHGMYTPNAIKWGDALPNLPKGSKIAVLYGDPSKEGLFVIQAKLPANYRIPAHSHPTDEVVTVLSGTLARPDGDPTRDRHPPARGDRALRGQRVPPDRAVRAVPRRPGQPLL